MLDDLENFLPAGIAGSIIAALVAITCALAGFIALHMARQQTPWKAVLAGYSAAVLLVVSVSFFMVALRAQERGWIIAIICVFFFGGAVGAAELISRYRDSPLRALMTAPGFFYVMLNAAGSAAALYLIFVYRRELGFADKDGGWPEDPGTLVKAVLLAGSASLVFFRSAIFKFRVGDSDLAIGPSIMLDTLLGAADRAVDRVMAEPRAVFVHRLMRDVAFEKAAVILPQHCVSLMQNVSSEESQRIVSLVNKLRADKESPDRIKTLNLGLALLSVVGEKVLATAVEYLQEDLQDSTAKLLEEVASVMQFVSFNKARRILPTYCFALWPTAISEEVAQKLLADLKALGELTQEEAPEGYKSLYLGIRLARLTDGATLRKAVEDLGDSIKAPLPAKEVRAGTGAAPSEPTPRAEATKPPSSAVQEKATTGTAEEVPAGTAAVPSEPTRHAGATKPPPAAIQEKATTGTAEEVPAGTAVAPPEPTPHAGATKPPPAAVHEKATAGTAEEAPAGTAAAPSEPPPRAGATKPAPAVVQENATTGTAEEVPAGTAVEPSEPPPRAGATKTPPAAVPRASV